MGAIPSETPFEVPGVDGRGEGVGATPVPEGGVVPAEVEVPGGVVPAEVTPGGSVAAKSRRFPALGAGAGSFVSWCFGLLSSVDLCTRAGP